MITTKSKLLINIKTDHIQGDPTAPIILLEYGDYECPYCGEAYHIIKTLQKKFGANLAFAFRNFPLAQIHPHAELAAEAAEAAALQNKFWKMHDQLFEHQAKLSRKELTSHAQKIGLNVEKFEKDLDSRILQPRVKRDLQSGLKNGVDSTPTFFINGERYNGSYQRLDEVLNSILVS